MFEMSRKTTLWAAAAQVVKSEAEDSLLRAWSATLAGASERPAILGPRGEVLRTFRQIEGEADELQRGSFADLSPGEVAAIQIGNHPSWPAALLGCLQRKIVVLPLESTISRHELDNALRTCRAAHLITAEQSELHARRIPLPEPIEWGEQVPALLKLTSGTTAAPRGIRFRSEQLLADCAQICDTMGITATDVNFGVIPFSHSYGFSNLITPLIARGVPLVVSRDRMPRAVVTDLAQSGATIFPGMPVFYQALCEMENVPAMPALRLCISAGAPLPLSVAHEFREKFRLAIHSFYGSSECGGICYDREARLVTPGLVGPPMRGLGLDLLEAGTRSGRAVVRSEAVGDGYFPIPDDEKLGAGRFIPDDLLASINEGFAIVGRVSDLINVAGKKVNPAEVERVLLRSPGVREAVVFGRESAPRNEEVAACAVTDDGVREEELLRSCREQLSGWQVPKRIFLVDKIPVNERGKISRRELAQRFERVASALCNRETLSGPAASE